MAELVEIPAVEQDLHCPLCDYNLRGLTEPRCPECGHRSTWEELRNRQPQHPYLFERQRKRRIRSVVVTWWRSLFPKRFWNELSPTLPPSRRRLSVFAVIILLLSIVGASAGMIGDMAMNVWRINQAQAVRRKQLVTLLNARGAKSPAGTPWPATQRLVQQFGSLQAYANALYPPMTTARFWRQITGGRSLGWLPYMALNVPTLMVVLWLPMTLLTLMIFRASLRQAKIRLVHVYRCAVYTISVCVLLGPLLFAALHLPIPLPTPYYLDFITGMSSQHLCVVLIMAALLAYRLGVAYRYYLRFDHPYLTVLSSQVIVLLAMLRLAMWMRGL